MKVAQDDEAVQKLQAFADANKQTQGKFTIGHEKVRDRHHPDLSTLSMKHADDVNGTET